MLVLALALSFALSSSIHFRLALLKLPKLPKPQSDEELEAFRKVWTCLLRFLFQDVLTKPQKTMKSSKQILCACSCCKWFGHLLLKLLKPNLIFKSGTSTWSLAKVAYPPCHPSLVASPATSNVELQQKCMDARSFCSFRDREVKSESGKPMENSLWSMTL